MCMWGSICFLQHKTASLIICRLIFATGTVLKQPCFAQLIESDFPCSLDLYLWHLKTCLPFFMAWHKPSKLCVLSFSFFFFFFLALQFYFFNVYSAPRCLFTRFSPVFVHLNFASKSTWPPSSKKKKKITQKYDQQPCLSVDSIQV